MIVKTKLATIFLLIQDGAVLDDAATPSFLHFKRANQNKDFQVAVGCINESGKKEILGVVANAIPRPGYTSVRISSEIDNHSRRVGATHSLSELVRQRLSLYWRTGLFRDISYLPKTVVVIGVE